MTENDRLVKFHRRTRVEAQWMPLRAAGRDVGTRNICESCILFIREKGQNFRSRNAEAAANLFPA